MLQGHGEPRYAILELHRHRFMDLFWAMSAGDWIKLKCEGLPKDARFVDMNYDWARQVLSLRFEHPSFLITAPGEPYYLLPAEVEIEKRDEPSQESFVDHVSQLLKAVRINESDVQKASRAAWNDQCVAMGCTPHLHNGEPTGMYDLPPGCEITSIGTASVDLVPATGEDWKEAIERLERERAMIKQLDIPAPSCEYVHADGSIDTI